jgi:hypothetical protein
MRKRIESETELYDVPSLDPPDCVHNASERIHAYSVLDRSIKWEFFENEENEKGLLV